MNSSTGLPCVQVQGRSSWVWKKVGRAAFPAQEVLRRTRNISSTLDGLRELRSDLRCKGYVWLRIVKSTSIGSQCPATNESQAFVAGLQRFQDGAEGCLGEKGDPASEVERGPVVRLGQESAGHL